MAGNPSIDVELGLIVNEFDNGVEKVTNKLKDLAGVMTRIGTVLSATVTAPILALGVASIKTFGNLEALQKGLIAVMGSAEAASGEFTKLIQVAKLPGLGLQEAARGSVALQAAGFSADQAREALLAFGNALATVGKGKNELNFVILALTQLQNKTSGFGQDLRQLTEQLPQLRGALTEAFGTADSEKIAELGVTGKEVVELITKEFAKLPAVTGGINNAFENLSDSTAISLARIGESINKAFDVEAILGKLGSMLDSVSTGFSKLDESTQVMIIAIAGLAAAIGPLLLAVGGIISLLPTLTAGLVALSGPFGLIAIAVAAAIPLLFKLNSELQRTKNIAGLVKADLLAESLKESRLEFERLSKALEGTGLTALEAQNRAIDLLLKQELDLLKARKDNKDIDFEAIKARVTALNALKETLNKVAKGTTLTLEEFSKLADRANELVFAKFAKDASDFNREIDQTIERLKRIDELSEIINKKQQSRNTFSGIVENGINVGGAPITETAKENPFDSLFKKPTDQSTLVTAFKEIEDQFKAFSGNFYNTVAYFTLGIKNIIQQNLGEAFAGIGMALGEALANGTSVIDALGKTLLNSLANFLGDLGQQLIAFGVAGTAFGILMEAITKGGPASIPAGIAAVGAGIALVAIAGAIRSTAGRGLRGGSSGGVGTGSSFTGSGGSTGLNADRGINLTGEFRVNGNDLLYVIDRSKESQV